MSASQWRKRPVVIDAMQWAWAGGPGETFEDIRSRVTSWVADSLGLTIDDHGLWHGPARKNDILGPIVPPVVGVDPYLFSLHIETLEGRMTAQPGDWIIRGVQGEFYPCKPDIFEQTYEPA